MENSTRDIIIAMLILVIPLIGAAYMLRNLEPYNGAVGQAATPSNEISAGERALQYEGYEDIELNGAAFFGCGEDSSPWTSSRFTAKKNGHTVNGAVCCGLISGLSKGCSVRTF